MTDRNDSWHRRPMANFVEISVEGRPGVPPCDPRAQIPPPPLEPTPKFVVMASSPGTPIRITFFEMATAEPNSLSAVASVPVSFWSGVNVMISSTRFLSTSDAPIRDSHDFRHYRQLACWSTMAPLQMT
jgi:hypothetical protein